MNHIGIVPAMKKTAILLALCAFAALPAAAQHNEFGILIGSTRPMKSGAGKGEFKSGMRELYYAMELDPGTMFRIEVGRMNTKTAIPLTGGGFEIDPHGTLEHADGVLEYPNSEPDGSIALFVSAGILRQQVNRH